MARRLFSKPIHAKEEGYGSPSASQGLKHRSSHGVETRPHPCPTFLLVQNLSREVIARSYITSWKLYDIYACLYGGFTTPCKIKSLNCQAWTVKRELSLSGILKCWIEIETRPSEEEERKNILAVWPDERMVCLLQRLSLLLWIHITFHVCTIPTYRVNWLYTVIVKFSRSLKQKWCWIIPYLPLTWTNECTDLTHQNINEDNSCVAREPECHSCRWNPELLEGNQ